MSSSIKTYKATVIKANRDQMVLRDDDTGNVSTVPYAQVQSLTQRIEQGDSLELEVRGELYYVKSIKGGQG